LKSRKTKRERYGKENYMAFRSPEFEKLMKERHGDENYCNMEKVK